MKTSILLLSFCLLSFVSYSQIELNIKDKKLDYFIQQEQSSQSILQKNKYHHILSDDIAQPLQYRREENNLPDLIVEYLYYKKDSIIQKILYEWDDNNLKSFKEQKKPKTSEEVQYFVNKYNELFSLISSLHGNPKSEGEIGDLNNIKLNSISKQDIWSTNDSITIDLQITLSSKYEQKGMITTVPTYKIRLYVKNPEKKVDSNNNSSNKTDPKELDIIFKEFLAELKQSNYDGLRKYLSPIISNSVTQQQLEALFQNIKNDDSLEVFYSGVQFGQKMELYNFLQYKYSTDKENPPTKIINVLFDSNNKIMSIQPLTR